MARVVVLTFEDNDTAQEFINALGFLQQTYEFASGMAVVGMFALPTQFCPGFCTKGRVKQWARGKKYGWWVCAGCGKPSRHSQGEKLWRNIVGQAVNLLRSTSEQEPRSVFDEGWGTMKTSLNESPPVVVAEPTETVS